MFSPNTTAIEALGEDLTEATKDNLMLLSKDVLCDLVTYLAALKPDKDGPVLTALHTVQSELKATEGRITSKIEKLEAIRTNVCDTETFPNNKPVHSVCNPDHITVHPEHIDQYTENYIDSSRKTELLEFCEKLDYRSENGHGVISFGERYNYTGSKSSPPEPMPTVIPLILTALLSK